MPDAAEVALLAYRRMGLIVDVRDRGWVLGGVSCPIVRFRSDWQRDGSSAG